MEYNVPFVGGCDSIITFPPVIDNPRMYVTPTNEHFED